MKKGLLLFLGLTTILAGCYNDKADKLYVAPAGTTTTTTTNTTCDTTAVSYKNTVKPITDQYCAISGCHESATQADGYDFSAYSGLARAAVNGDLKGSVLHTPGYIAMPANGATLSDCQVNDIVAWANQGAQNN